jgi:hypothetical protein
MRHEYSLSEQRSLHSRSASSNVGVNDENASATAEHGAREQQHESTIGQSLNTTHIFVVLGR